MTDSLMCCAALAVPYFSTISTFYRAVVSAHGIENHSSEHGQDIGAIVAKVPSESTHLAITPRSVGDIALTSRYRPRRARLIPTGMPQRPPALAAINDDGSRCDSARLRGVGIQNVHDGGAAPDE